MKKYIDGLWQQFNQVDEHTRARHMLNITAGADIHELRFEILDTPEAEDISIDLADVEFIDSGFVNLMVEIKNRHPELHQRIRIVNPSDFVLQMLKRMYLDRIYEVFQIGDQPIQ